MRDGRTSHSNSEIAGRTFQRASKQKTEYGSAGSLLENYERLKAERLAREATKSKEKYWRNDKTAQTDQG